MSYTKKLVQRLLPHFIIVSKQRNAIWKKPFNTLGEAKKEFEEQKRQLRGEAGETTGDWVIEEMESIRLIEDTNYTEVDNDFANF